MQYHPAKIGTGAAVGGAATLPVLGAGGTHVVWFIIMGVFLTGVAMAALALIPRKQR